MKLLIGVMSCVQHEINGYNDVLRRSWIKSAREFDCRFFIGDGTVSDENEEAMFDAYAQDNGFHGKTLLDPDLSLMPRTDDQIILPVSDSYIRQIKKLRAACKWAVGAGYDYMFQVLTDTYVIPERLALSGFQQYDYIGTANHERTYLGAGPGFWLSRRAMQIIAGHREPIVDWSHDVWIGKVLAQSGIQPVHDSRYTNLDQGDEPPTKYNDVITSHIANTPTVYDPQDLLKLWTDFGQEHKCQLIVLDKGQYRRCNEKARTFEQSPSGIKRWVCPSHTYRTLAEFQDHRKQTFLHQGHTEAMWLEKEKNDSAQSVGEMCDALGEWTPGTRVTWAPDADEKYHWVLRGEMQ